MGNGTVEIRNPYYGQIDIATQWTIIDEIAVSLDLYFEKDEVTVAGPLFDTHISVIRGVTLGLRADDIVRRNNASTIKQFTEPLAAYQYLRYLVFRYRVFELPMHLWGE